MDFELIKMSDVGTSNPIVARLSIQTNELIRLFPLTDKQKNDVNGLLGMDICERLISCYKIFTKLQDELEKVNQTNKDEYFKGNAVYTPAVMDLRNMCENFLYQSKSTLRDLLGIFKIFFNKDFSKARYDMVYEWACKKFGDQDSLTKILKEDHDLWIKRIISMRNAIEHPGGYSGYLNIKNITLINKNQPPYFNAPSWCLNDEEESPILTDMATFIENTIGLCEDLLVILLGKLPNGNLPLIFVKIPVEQRNPDCPVRLKVSLPPELLP